MVRIRPRKPAANRAESVSTLGATRRAWLSEDMHGQPASIGVGRSANSGPGTYVLDGMADAAAATR